MILTAIAAVPLCIWTYLLLGRGGFWRMRKHLLPPLDHTQEPDPTVVAIVPARDEADVIARSVSSLVRERMVRHIVLVDDGSTDGTAAQASNIETNKLTILSAGPREPGWTGKLWALSRGIQHAQNFEPDYFLLTDADIEHGGGAIGQLVRLARARNLDLASYMVLLHCETVAERALIPAFVFFFLKLYPPNWTASRSHQTAGAAGGCILIRPHTLERIGGLQAISQQIIDDCALARAVKLSGGRVWLGLTQETHSIRPYGGFTAIGRMISRTAFNQLNHSALLLAGTLGGLFATYLLPPILAIGARRTPRSLGAAAWLLMSAAYFSTVRFYRRNPLWIFALPGIAAFYAGATVHSALLYWRGAGGEWKGRIQDVRIGPAHPGV